MQVAIPDEWRDRDPPQATRTKMQMAIDHKPDDVLLFCPSCGWHQPFGKNMGMLSARTRVKGHNDDCRATQAYVVTRAEMLDYWDQAKHLD